MDLDEINLLTDQQKQKYMSLMRMFESDGWKIMDAWASANSDEARERAAMAATWEENRIYAGQRVVYDIVRKLPEINEQEYAILAQQNREAKEEESEVDPSEYE
jgi:predicted DNA binding protein